MTTVVNMRQKKGLPRAQWDIRVDRSTIFGNPYVIGRDGDRKEVVSKFISYFLTRMLTDTKFRNRVLELKDRALGCWCEDNEPCHARFIAKFLNEYEIES
jgi:hypothetical protein